MSVPSTASRRLQKEYQDLLKTPQGWMSASVVGDNLHKWKATVIGPEGSPFEKGTFEIDLDIPNDYPFKPPALKFTTKIYHPNIKSDGSVCSELLSQNWSPQLKIQDVLVTIRALLTEPNPDNPLEADIAQQFKTDRNAFNKTAKEWTKKYAK
ncbi:ubiquitin-conjugating enzyme E2 [Cavenderia fasciculata]|uniref:Ubiquitin-conjugating enzyme E2 n=1 Tax=Cavenderia fasciculata TaxID=261658 RepID=F4Q0Q7_CACFS|nr:ubiquitin-conjugating enzyme E2 [Cavenderia fasciculata]EGG18408.1 ubiquitin-conjugating enzyme E2 [Cavenderia fasciculata]|eukprot:XP_004366312.1 ubiquitin-conjugating enzyme E2 [Cavenderia fasciculata]